MKEIVVLSGKGGTGKTTVLASFAALAENSVLCDCDVDAPNLHLLLVPQAEEAHEFYGLQVAHIDSEACNECGLCVDACRFEAIDELRVDPMVCEGCGLCARVCPLDAISMRDTLAGHWYVSNTNYGPLVHARLQAAQENSGKLVMAVRKRARELAQETGAAFILSDGPPGIGCPAISSLSGASAGPDRDRAQPQRHPRPGAGARALPPLRRKPARLHKQARPQRRELPPHRGPLPRHRSRGRRQNTVRP